MIQNRVRSIASGRKRRILVLLKFATCLLCALPWSLQAQSPRAAQGTEATSTQTRIESLLQAMDRTQKQIEASQRDLDAMRQELKGIQAQVSATETTTTAAASQPPAASQDDSALQASQIATLDQVKVESESKYPVRLTGTVLLNGFSNSTGVDQVEAPSASFGGPGSTGLSIRQTVLGVDADGPHLFGGRSRADLRVDFAGSSAAASYASVGGLLRLRTAHASLNWSRTSLFFMLDRSLLNPNLPESLVAVAQPEMAWSGNLWSWVPQVGLSHTLGTRRRFSMAAALLDPLPADAASSSATANPNTAERSRKPGIEARSAFSTGAEESRAEFGVGGYFSPHLVPANGVVPSTRFQAWAATFDFRLPLSHRLLLTGNLYRGQALGGLGGGGYKDYVYQQVNGGLQLRPLADIGGWVQLHQKLKERLSWNAGFGLDNAFSSQLRAAAATQGEGLYGSIARNRTVFANFIYSPSAYLLFSAEYRQLYTAPVVGPLWVTHVTGIGAAYRF